VIALIAVAALMYEAEWEPENERDNFRRVSATAVGIDRAPANVSAMRA
jgi:hypothetical protein